MSQPDLKDVHVNTTGDKGPECKKCGGPLVKGKCLKCAGKDMKKSPEPVYKSVREILGGVRFLSEILKDRDRHPKGSPEGGQFAPKGGGGGGGGGSAQSGKGGGSAKSIKQKINAAKRQFKPGMEIEISGQGGTRAVGTKGKIVSGAGTIRPVVEFEDGTRATMSALHMKPAAAKSKGPDAPYQGPRDPMAASPMQNNPHLRAHHMQSQADKTDKDLAELVSGASGFNNKDMPAESAKYVSQLRALGVHIGGNAKDPEEDQLGLGVMLDESAGDDDSESSVRDFLRDNVALARKALAGDADALEQLTEEYGYDTSPLKARIRKPKK